MIPLRPLPRCQREIPCIAWGSFKIGRNTGIKYPEEYPLPSDAQSRVLISEILQLGVRLIDTAPAYGLAEARIGEAVPAGSGVLISTKVGETFNEGSSHYDFSTVAVEQSIRTSMTKLQRPCLDIVHIHADADDVAILRDGSCLKQLEREQSAGRVGMIGFSGRTLEGFGLALDDPRIQVLMVEYGPHDDSMRVVLDEAARRHVGVMVKKPLGSGRSKVLEAVPFILAHEAVSCLIVGTTQTKHLAEVIVAAARCS
ncbi:MAG: aldo/keto reductase [Phycisphaerales bacterium]|nr:aldo/keto reductase [Phycisphaerales bacterium]